MERVAFLREDTAVRIGCLLNPNSVVLRRAAGVRPRTLNGRPVTGAGLSHDPLLYTGGGSTELILDLLFDVSLGGSTVATDDVRDLTRPLWQLSENDSDPERYGRPPVVRLVWGKSWNIRGIVAAVAERLEFFTQDGLPRRAQLRILVKILDDVRPPPAKAAAPISAVGQLREDAKILPEQIRVRETTAGTEIGGEGPDGSVERLDEIAYQEYGDPRLWRLIAEFNDLDDPTQIEGQTLAVPDLSVMESE